MQHHDRDHERRAKAHALISRTGHHGMPHPDKQQDIALIKSAIRQHEDAEHGGKHAPIKLKHGGAAHGKHERKRLDKRARGGAAKGDSSTTVIVMPQAMGAGKPGGSGGMMPDTAAGVPQAAPPMPPAPSPAAMAMPSGPGSPPPGLAPRKHGGRAHRADGGTDHPASGHPEPMPAPRKHGGHSKRAIGGVAPTLGSTAAQATPALRQPAATMAPAAGRMMAPQPRARGGDASCKRADGGSVEPGGPKRIGAGRVPGGINGGAGGGRGRIEKVDHLPYVVDKGGRGRA